MPRVWSRVATALGGALTMAVITGFGVSVVDLPSPETPVLYGFLHDRAHRAGWYYATPDCVESGASLDGYVLDRNLVWALDEIQNLNRGIEITTLGRARRLVHDAPAFRDADPLCAAAGGFSGRERPLISKLFGK